MPKQLSQFRKKLQANILRLRFGTEEPTIDMKPIFSHTCIAKYLHKEAGLVKQLVRAYFYLLLK